MQQTKTRAKKRPPLIDFIRQNFGTSRHLAEQLGVTPQTVTNWVQSNPLQLLKHLDQIKAATGAKPEHVTKAALAQLKHLQKHGRKQ